MRIRDLCMHTYVKGVVVSSCSIDCLMRVTHLCTHTRMDITHVHSYAFSGMLDSEALVIQVHEYNTCTFTYLLLNA